MNFTDLATQFERAESGSDSFKSLYQSSFDLMKVDPANAAGYFVVGIAAQAYVRKYEDQGVEPETADRAKALMEGLNALVTEALSRPEAERLGLFSEAAMTYEHEIHLF